MMTFQGGVAADNIWFENNLQQTKALSHFLAVQALIKDMTLANNFVVWRVLRCTIGMMTKVLELSVWQTILPSSSATYFGINICEANDTALW